MLYSKNTIKFQSFSKGWIPDTEVFPNGNPNDSAIDIVNFDVDSLKGGLVKTNGYSADDAEYAAALTAMLGDHEIQRIHNYSLGIPLQADLLLAVAYYASGTPKYKWLLRDMIVNDAKLSSGDFSRWYNLLLSFKATVSTTSTLGNVTRLNISNVEAEGGEVVDALDNIIPRSLDGFIVNVGTEGAPVYRTVVYSDETYVLVTPQVVVADGTEVTFYRSRLSLDADFNSIFNPSQEYSAFVVNNIMSKLMIGLGKEIKPLWLGYINKHYFYNKTNSAYLLDYSGSSCQRGIVLEKRVPEYSPNVLVGYARNDGVIKPLSEVQLALTVSFDGYQEIMPIISYGTMDSNPISLRIKIKDVNQSIFAGQTISPVSTVLQSGFYIKLLEGSTTKVEIRFIAKENWQEFIENIDLSANPNKIWIRYDTLYNTNTNYNDVNNLAYYLYLALSQHEQLRNEFYIGTYTFTDLNYFDYTPATSNTEYPTIAMGSTDAMQYSPGSEWIFQTNQRTYFNIIETNALLVEEDSNYDDKYYFNDGQTNPTSTENILELKVPNNYNSLKVTIKPNLIEFNRRITSFSIWGRYKPDDETVGKWLTPFYLLKKIEVNDTNANDTDSTDGWAFDGIDLQYETYIKKLYGKELEGISDSDQISDETLAQLAGLKNIPQLLATLKYEPSVGIAAKYGAATIHNNTAWIADTDDKVEVLRFSRTGSTGTNNLDVFSYDFDSSIGFEMIGQDSPGHITALASRDDELLVLRDNSFFSIKTGVETISVKQCGNYVGCKYPRSVVTCRYGVIFADDNGVWLYQGMSSGNINVIQINWQWDNAYKAATKTNLFACWNGQTEEYWLHFDNYIFVADFKNIQSIDQSMALMKDKEKIIVPWRKKKFAATINAFTVDSYGNLIFASDDAVFWDNLNVYSMAGAEYASLYVESKVITQHSPMLKIYEVLTETLKDSSVNDWKFDLKLYVNGKATERQSIKMWGNCNNQESLVCVRPVNLGTAVNDVSIKVDMSTGNGTTAKKLRAFGLNIMTRKAKHVSE
ncbi:MAG: hypothetical protein WC549_01840 [Actinomycetota bacterium]